jgi:glutathione S-transferase
MLTIYGVPLSVHTRKVILAARLKRIPHEIEVVVPVLPGNPPPNWRQISPTGLIPVIKDDGFFLPDSTAIVHYLERRHPEPLLLPKDDRDLATAIFLDAWAGSALFQKVVHPIFQNQVVRPNIQKVPGDNAAIETALDQAAPEAFGYLDGLNPETFLVNGALTIADLAVVSNLIVFHYLGRRIDSQRFPRLQAYFTRHLSSDLFRQELAEEAPFADQMGLDRSFVG